MKGLLQLTKTAKESITSYTKGSNNDNSSFATSRLLPIIGTASIATASIGAGIYYAYYCGRKSAIRNSLEKEQTIHVSTEIDEIMLARQAAEHAADTIRKAEEIAANTKTHLNNMSTLLRGIRIAAAIEEAYRYSQNTTIDMDDTTEEPGDTVSKEKYKDARKEIKRLKNKIKASKPIIREFHRIAMELFSVAGDSTTNETRNTMKNLRCIVTEITEESCDLATNKTGSTIVIEETYDIVDQIDNETQLENDATWHVINNGSVPSSSE